MLGGPENSPWLPYSEQQLQASGGTAVPGCPPSGNQEAGRDACPTKPYMGLIEEFDSRLQRLDKLPLSLLREWQAWDANYDGAKFTYQVRGRDIQVDNYRQSLSELPIRKVARPQYRDAGDRLLWRLLENVPGEFPYTAGTFPYKRQAEDPTRMFAG